MFEWSVDEPGKLVFDDPVTSLHVRVVNGVVNVVGTDEGPARLEVTELQGEPLKVAHEHGVLTVAYEDLPWKGFLKWVESKGWRRSVTVTLAVPADAHVEVGVVGAHAMISGITGRTDVKGVSGETTLVGLTGPVTASTVSGGLEAQSLAGDLRFNSVSGDLTVVAGTGPTVRADSVSGSMIVDLGHTDRRTSITLTNVSGEIALRLPDPGNAEVRANTASGTISTAFEDLKVSGPWGAHRVTGRLGEGRGQVRATTVSGSIALLRRPAAEDESWDGERPSDPAGDNSGTGQAPSAGGTTDKKVL